MINFNTQAPPIHGPTHQHPVEMEKSQSSPTDFSNHVKAIEGVVAKVDDMQHASNLSVQDLLAGKNNDITSVVSDVAKADMSFKLLVGVRNKLIEAYKQTMNMQL